MVIKDIINELYAQNRRGRYSACDFIKDHLIIDFGESPKEKENYEMIIDKNAAYIVNPLTKSKNVASVYDANELRLFLLKQYKVSEKLGMLVAHNEEVLKELCSDLIYDRSKFREMLVSQINSGNITDNQKEALKIIEKYYDYVSDGCNFTACVLCALFYPKYGKAMISHKEIMDCLDNIYHRFSEEYRYMLTNILSAVEYNLGILGRQFENMSEIMAAVDRTPVLQATNKELLAATQPGVCYVEKVYEILKNLPETIEHYQDNIYTYARDVSEPDQEWLSRLKLSVESLTFLHDGTFEIEVFFGQLTDKIKKYMLDPQTATGYPEQKKLFITLSEKIISYMSELFYWHYVLLLCPVSTSIDINERVQFISEISMFREHSLDFRVDLQKEDEAKEKIVSLEKRVRTIAGNLLSMDLPLDVPDFIAKAGFTHICQNPHYRNEKYTYVVWGTGYFEDNIDKRMIADWIGSICVRQDKLFHIVDQLLNFLQNQVVKRNKSIMLQIGETINNTIVTFQNMYESPVIYMTDSKIIPILCAMKINYKELEILVNSRYECIKDQISSLNILKEYVYLCDYESIGRYCESYKRYQEISGAYHAISLYYPFINDNDIVLLQYIYENITKSFRSFPKTEYKEEWLENPRLLDGEVQKILDRFECCNLEMARTVGIEKVELEKLREKIRK